MTPRPARRSREEMLLDTPLSFLGAPGRTLGRGRRSTVERRGHPFNCVLGAHDVEGNLVSTATIIRDDRVKLRHKGMIVSVYTQPECGAAGSRRVLLGADRLCARHSGHGRRSDLGVRRGTGCPGRHESMGFAAWGREPRALRIEAPGGDEVHMSLGL